MVPRLLKGPFTVASYQRLAELGVLREDDRVELIDGQVVEMSPIGDRHASCVRRLNRRLSRDLRDVALVDVQNPVVLDEYDAPQPDLAVLKPRADGYTKHPRAADTLLVIEVSDTSVAYDRDIKIPLYARLEFRRPGWWISRQTRLRCTGSLPAGNTPACGSCPAATRSARCISPGGQFQQTKSWGRPLRPVAPYLLERDGRLLPIEEKTTDRVGPSDARGLNVFLEDYDRRTPAALLLYDGPDLRWVADRVLAAPWYSAV